MLQIALVRALLASLLEVFIASMDASRVFMYVEQLDMGVDVVVVVTVAADIWCRYLGRCWVWWTSVVQICGDVQGRGSGAIN